MANIFEIIVWGVGFALLHEGIAQGGQNHNRMRKNIAIALGALILVGGAVLWYLSAQSLKRLSDTQQITTPGSQLTRQSESIESAAPHMRKEISTKLAKSAFANGEEGVKIFTEDGQWVPYAPDSEDLIAREIHLKAVNQIKKQRQELLFSARTAEKDAIHWLFSSLIAVLTGIAAVFLRRSSMRR